MTSSIMETLEDDKNKAIPIYLVVDTSYSMKDDGKIEAANEIVPTVIATCKSEPMVDQAARFSVIDFCDEAHVVVPLTKGSAIQAPTFTASRGTNYSKAFAVLRKQIEQDYHTLKGDGFTLYRPFVVLITDGEPICEPSARYAAFEALTDPGFTRRPNMCVFGVGNEVAPETLQQYKAGRGIAIATREGADAAEALGTLVATLMQSVVASATAGAADDDGPNVDIKGMLEDDDDFIIALGQLD